MSAIPADIRMASPWRQALPAIALAWAALLFIYRDTALAMVAIWARSDTFAHAFLVPPISLWLIWRRRADLARLQPSPQPWWLLPMLLVAAVWLAAELVAVNAAAQFALVGMLVLAVPAVLGLQVAKAMLFPLLFLFFAVPFGEFMLPSMMQWTADFAVLALQLTGVPVYREGLWFIIPSGSWSVIDECSGVRYLIASFMVGTLFAYLNYRSYTRRAIFMVVSLLLPVVANWLRAYMIVMMAHLSGNKIGIGVDHLLYGWVFFGIVIFIMFIVGSRWSEPDAPKTEAAAEGARYAGAGAPHASSWPVIAAALAVALIALLPSLALHGLERSERAGSQVKLELPPDLAPGWSAQSGSVSGWSPKFVNPSATAQRSYSGPKGVVGVYVAYYRGSDRERKLVSSQNVLVAMKDKDWNLLAGGTRAVDAGPRTIEVRTARILANDHMAAASRPQLTVWRTYWIDGRFVAGDAAAKLAGAWARLRGRGNEGAVLVLHTDNESAAAANATLEAFVRANLGELNALLQRVQDAR